MIFVKIAVITYALQSSLVCFIREKERDNNLDKIREMRDTQKNKM